MPESKSENSITGIKTSRQQQRTVKNFGQIKIEQMVGVNTFVGIC